MVLSEIVEELQPKIGSEIHMGAWLAMTQERINEFAFSSKDFIIEGVQFPLPEIKDDPFFGPSEIYHNVVEATLRLAPKTEGNSKGILDIAYQGCWEGGVCYPL